MTRFTYEGMSMVLFGKVHVPAGDSRRYESGIAPSAKGLSGPALCWVFLDDQDQLIDNTPRRAQLLFPRIASFADNVGRIELYDPSYLVLLFDAITYPPVPEQEEKIR
ncbi:MAG: hypothetical protein H6883_07360 [Rhodobiaceae bacterium]|nr:hypothetical protein [Rhodobiaceae bacterium]MCC0055938.1 hypothetical protein [Rhodobiaceae bacterium]